MIDRDTIIKLARKAGLHRNQHNLASNPVQYRFSYDGYEENLERFAALVAAAEREACAQMCDEAAIRLFSGKSRVNQVDRHTAEVLRSKAGAIRARSQA